MSDDRIRVVSLLPLGADGLARIRGASVRLDVVDSGPNTQAQVDALDDADVEVLLSSYAPARPERLPKLRWIASVTAGVEELLANHPERNKIVVTNGSGLHAVAMGEYALAAMLQITQRIPARIAAQRERRWLGWQTPEWHAAAGTRLRGSTVGIVGYGSVGREVARVSSALGLRVIALKARPTERLDGGYREAGTGDPDGVIPSRIFGFEELGALLGESDLVVVTAPLTTQTKDLVNERFLSQMRPSAWLINIGRGAHANEADLLTALRVGRIAGAVLDVFSAEPLPPSSPFWALENVIITPHLAGVNEWDRFWSSASWLLAENLRRYASGEPLLNVVRPERGY